jgi:hypothetical protein
VTAISEVADRVLPNELIAAEVVRGVHVADSEDTHGGRLAGRRIPRYSSRVRYLNAARAVPTSSAASETARSQR